MNRRPIALALTIFTATTLLAGCAALPGLSFVGTGQTQQVGLDVEPGRYVSTSTNPECDWRIEDAAGQYRWNTDADRFELWVKPTDRNVIADRECGTWTRKVAA